MRIGLRPSEIAKSLTEKYGIAQRHAKFIARDQAAKVNGEITKQRQLDAGFVAFRWLDADDSRVRHRHREIANADIGMGKGVYLWSDLPMGEEGVPIQPGSTYNCRCVSRPVRTSVINATIAQRKKQLQSA
jgi:SPP1 gp7 family putative phage head morphogenesis protein